VPRIPGVAIGNAGNGRCVHALSRWTVRSGVKLGGGGDLGIRDELG
jgi:hypothetical protein